MTKLFEEIKACKTKEDQLHILTFVSHQDLKEEFIRAVESDKAAETMIKQIKKKPGRPKKTDAPK